MSTRAAAAPAGGPAVFAALGDPTRMALLARLGDGGAATATLLAEPFPMTRQAVSRHLRVLAEAGLVRTSKQGRDVLYAVEPAALRDQGEWLTSVSRAWDRRLLDLKGRAETE